MRHYSDDARQKLDYKLSYNLPGGGEYTGLQPPTDASIKGVLYPRTATLGGCTAHNALVTIYPDQSDFQYIQNLTGDSSWAPANLRKYWEKLEKNHYLPAGTAGHGFSGWLGTQVAPITLALKDTKLLGQIVGAATALGKMSKTLQNLGTLLAGDANAPTLSRDQTSAIYQVPIATTNGARNGAREFILQVYNAKNSDGSKKYPLDIRMNCFVTKVTFDTTKSPPQATGVKFLDGKSLYRADSRSSKAAPGKPGSALASREVIVSGGSYNSPQILKLSGVGPVDELKKFNIPVIADLPGVGTNLQDHYEVVVQGTTPKNYSTLEGCTFEFNGASDPCVTKWQKDRQSTYASSGFAAAMLVKTNATPDGNYDIFEFGGPVNFRGYFPGYSYNATVNHNWWSWAILKSHPRNRAGSVTLASADPLDVPNILFNYFDTGSGDYAKDLEAIYEGIQLARAAFKATSGQNITEVLPGPRVQSKADIESYVKNTAWGHHCSCTCAIGADNDPMAVLDSSFRVRKVQGLRVVDASVYPRIPGTFTAASTYLVGEKAADVILQGLKK